MDERIWLENIYREQIDMLIPVGRYFAGKRGDDILFDAIQDVFLVLWKKRSSLMQHPNIGGWLVDALKLQLVSQHRKMDRRAAHHAFSIDSQPESALAPDMSHLDESLILQEKLAQLKEILGSENADIFLAYTLEGRTAKELAAQYGVSESSVWMRVSRMKKKLMRHPEIFLFFLFGMIGLQR